MVGMRYILANPATQYQNGLDAHLDTGASSWSATTFSGSRAITSRLFRARPGCATPTPAANERKGALSRRFGTCDLHGASVARRMKKIDYDGYRFPPAIIQQAVWLYFRFTLSFRDVEDLLAERGIMVSYETVRRWVNHFGPMIAADLRKRRPKPYTTWHLDEVYLKISGRMVYLWRAVDAEGQVLDVLVQSKRNKHAALKLMRKLLKKCGFVPDRLITDDLRSYGAAAHDLGISSRHERGRWKNNRAENSHQRPDAGSARCNASRARAQRKDFSPLTLPSSTPSTSNATSLPLQPIALSAPRR